MTDYLALAADFVMFCMTILWVGKKPTVPKVTLMICIVTVVHVCIDAAVAASQGMSIYGMYADSYQTALGIYEKVLSADQMQMLVQTSSYVAGCWFGIYAIQSAFLVGLGLVLVWAAGRVTKSQRNWGAFSKVDLPIWTVFILIAGLVVLSVSSLDSVPYRRIVLLVALNMLVISYIPLFVQGFAACKGMFNRTQVPGFVVAVIFLVLLFVGVAPVVIPVVGLVDYWANLRRLPRDGEDPAAE